MGKELLVSGNIAKDSILGEEFFGGSGAAIAISTRKLGIGVGLLSVLGKDYFSERYKNYLISLGIDLSLVTQPLQELPTYYVFDKKDTLSSWEWRDNGREEALNELNVDLELVSQYRLVHLVGTPPLLAKRLSKANNVIISYEPGPTVLHIGEYAEPEVIAKSYFLFANEDEFTAIAESLNFSTPERFLEAGPKALIVTRGAKGSDVWQRHEGQIRKISIDAFSVSRIVDPTGAGDAYKAAFLAGYLRGYDLETCARFGSVLGALAVTQKGVILKEETIAEFRFKSGY